MFAEKAAHDQVKCVSLKLSQGAKPGMGGVLPGSKVNAEIAKVREVPQGQTVVSPPYHRVFSTPRELVRFIGRMRELAGGKPTGFKLCLTSRRQFLAVCKAMLSEGVTPDFIVVDGAEGGTGAAPLEFADHVGTPLAEGLITVHNALVGTGLRDRVRVGASGKVATGSDMVKRMAQGADYTNAARAMMFATGCIQAQRCHINTCPVGVATQDPGAPAHWTWVTSRRAWSGSSGPRCTGRCRSWRPWASMTPPSCVRTCCGRGSPPSPSAPTRSCTSGWLRGSCSPSPRRRGPRTGPPPTPASSPSDPARHRSADRSAASSDERQGRYEPVDRFWLAALSGLIPRCRWREVFPVTPPHCSPGIAGSSRRDKTTARGRTGRPEARAALHVGRRAVGHAVRVRSDREAVGHPDRRPASVTAGRIGLSQSRSTSLRRPVHTYSPAFSDGSTSSVDDRRSRGRGHPRPTGSLR